MARILVLHYADLSGTRESVIRGEAPDHLLFGINHFERDGHEVTVAPFEHSRVLQRATRAMRRLPVPLGDLDQQRSVLRMARKADLVYAPSQGVAQVLGYLRASGAFDRPIVSLIHHPLDAGRLRRWRRPLMRRLLNGLDAYPALSTPVTEELARIAGTRERTELVRWGPDPRFYPAELRSGWGVVAAGCMNRDFDTFAAAARQTDIPTWIVCPTVHQPRCAAGENTTIISSDEGHALPFRQVVQLYAQARVIAIPLNVGWPLWMNGLTSVMDALGMGKPMVITRHPLIDIDVEGLGIGICVDPADIDGWRTAITYLHDNDDVALEMGRRARALVDDGRYSSSAFAAQIAKIFERVLVPAR